MKTYFINGRKNSSMMITKSESDNVEVCKNNSLNHHLNNNIIDSAEAKSLPSLETEPDKSEGKVIINKLHRFLRQRSVPANSNLTGADDDATEEMVDKDADVDENSVKNASVSEDISNAEQMDMINNIESKVRELIVSRMLIIVLQSSFYK